MHLLLVAMHSLLTSFTLFGKLQRFRLRAGSPIGRARTQGLGARSAHVERMVGAVAVTVAVSCSQHVWNMLKPLIMHQHRPGLLGLQGNTHYIEMMSCAPSF